MARIFTVSLVLLAFASVLVGQGIPQDLRGAWVVSRVIPTRTISCWGQKEANRLIGTVIEYRSDSFRWKNLVTAHPSVTTSIMDADQFEREYSGGGAADSRVTFGELGIQAQQATIIQLGHAAANITGASIEIPGDWALIKGGNAIVIAVCNVYFEAHRQRYSSLSKR